MSLKPFNKSDLWFTADGDFLIDGAGDLRDTLDSGDDNEGLKQTILHRLVGEKNAYGSHDGVTAGLERFIGKTIDSNLLEAIEFSVHRALVYDSVLNREDYVIRVFEIIQGNVAILIFVNLEDQEHPVVGLVWNVKYGEVTRL